MIREHRLALQSRISVIESLAREKNGCQAIADCRRTGREPALDHYKNGSERWDRGENEKVHESKEVKIAWHAAPVIAFD
jgi:hypothetical protein